MGNQQETNKVTHFKFFNKNIFIKQKKKENKTKI
jgi:hypothetical protein